MKKKELADEIRRYTRNGNAGVITKSEFARYLGLKKPTQRVNRILQDLVAHEGKYYDVADVAETYMRML